jgi:hypothetical protein
MTAVENYVTQRQLDAMLAGGWRIKRREQLVDEQRELITLSHADKTYGMGYRGPVETFRSLRLDLSRSGGPAQLLLFTQSI